MKLINHNTVRSRSAIVNELLVIYAHLNDAWKQRDRLFELFEKFARRPIVPQTSIRSDDNEFFLRPDERGGSGNVNPSSDWMKLRAQVTNDQ